MLGGAGALHPRLAPAEELPTPSLHVKGTQARHDAARSGANELGEPSLDV